MKDHKTIYGVAVLLAIGVVLFYFVTNHEKSKEGFTPLDNKHLGKDSVTMSDHHVVPFEMGPKPEKNIKDGSIKIVEAFVKSNSKNPASFEFLEWSEISSEGGYWKVRCKYKGISSFNAEVTTNAWFYIKNNKVVRTKIISKI